MMAGFAAAVGVAAAVTLAVLFGPPPGAVDLGMLGPGAAHAVSSEQLLFLEVGESYGSESSALATSVEIANGMSAVDDDVRPEGAWRDHVMVLRRAG